MNLFYGITLITKRQLKKLENHKKRENEIVRSIFLCTIFIGENVIHLVPIFLFQSLHFLDHCSQVGY